MFSVYIIRTKDNKLYIGQTRDLSLRSKEHRTSKGSKFLKDNHQGFSVIYKEDYLTLLEAMRREKQLKGWTRAKKEALIANDLKKLKEL